MTPREIGDIGEAYTADFLVGKGCEILARNVAIKGGEIDIIAKKGSLIHFVEVKSRKSDPLANGESAITKTKIARIVKTAKAYVAMNDIELSCIFDVAVVEIDDGKVTGFKYYQRAFTA